MAAGGGRRARSSPRWSVPPGPAAAAGGERGRRGREPGEGGESRVSCSASAQAESGRCLGGREKSVYPTRWISGLNSGMFWEGGKWGDGRFCFLFLWGVVFPAGQVKVDVVGLSHRKLLVTKGTRRLTWNCSVASLIHWSRPPVAPCINPHVTCALSPACFGTGAHQGSEQICPVCHPAKKPDLPIYKIARWGAGKQSEGGWKPL